MMGNDMATEVLDRLRALPHAAVAIRALAPEPGVHVVGGAVRDVLLGREPIELDLVVEGDAVPVARRVAARIGGDVRIHERFGTATVSAPQATFDLAATRRELYPSPGALPTVEIGATLAEDLERRDFTVNAMAISVHDGHLSAHPLALADLDARRLRVLHPASFGDDPTRLLRLCRYAARLGLVVEPGTRALVRQAVAEDRLLAVSGDRIGRELRRLVAEPQPAALLALAEHGLGEQILSPAFAVYGERIERALALCPADARGDLVALAATLTEVPPVELESRLDALGFQRRERECVVAAATRARGVADTLTAGAEPEVWDLLTREAAETVALAGALATDPRAEPFARGWLDDLRHRDTVLSGHDLEAVGLSGPAVGRGLRAARAAVRQGRAGDFEQQLEVALAAARRG